MQSHGCQTRPTETVVHLVRSDSAEINKLTEFFASKGTSERLLVARGKAGDDSAFTELIRQSTPGALRMIRSIARNPADVEDVMQDTVVDAFKGLHSFDQRSAFSTWLRRIAINNALPLIRRQKGKIEIGFDEPNDGRRLQIADHRINPEQARIREQSNRIGRRAVRALPSSLRAYVEHRCLRELPHREAASSLGISVAAGKSRSLRARQRLLFLLASRSGGSTAESNGT